MNPLSELETPTALYQQRTDPADRKSVRNTAGLNTIDHLDMTDTYRLHPTAAECTFFPSSHGTFSITKRDHILGQEHTLTNYNRKNTISAPRPQWK